MSDHHFCPHVFVYSCPGPKTADLRSGSSIQMAPKASKASKATGKKVNKAANSITKKVQQGPKKKPASSLTRTSNKTLT